MPERDLPHRALRRLLRPAIAQAEVQTAELWKAIEGLRADVRTAADRLDEVGRAQDELRVELQSAWGETGRRLAALDVRQDEGVAWLSTLEQHVASSLGDQEARITMLREGLQSTGEAVVRAVAAVDLPDPGATKVIRSGGGPAGPRRAICSHATGPYRSMLGLSAAASVSYAARWGWDVVLSADDSLADGRPQSWAKVPLLTRILADYDYVWWIDADAVIVDFDRDVGDVLSDDKDLFLVEHRFDWDYGDGMQPQRFPNFGVFFIRGGAWSQELLQAIWAREDLAHSHWWENTALLELIGYGTYPAGPRRDTPWRERVEFVDKAWNSLDDLDESEHPVVKHHAGNAPFEERKWRLLQDVLGVTSNRA